MLFELKNVTKSFLSLIVSSPHFISFTLLPCSHLHFCLLCKKSQVISNVIGHFNHFSWFTYLTYPLYHEWTVSKVRHDCVLSTTLLSRTVGPCRIHWCYTWWYSQQIIDFPLINVLKRYSHQSCPWCRLSDHTFRVASSSEAIYQQSGWPRTSRGKISWTLYSVSDWVQKMVPASSICMFPQDSKRGKCSESLYSIAVYCVT